MESSAHANGHDTQPAAEQDAAEVVPANPDGPSTPIDELPEGARFADWLRSGNPAIVVVLTARCERVASRQFSAWAWNWVREDFVADLASQLNSAVQNPEFELRGAAGAYVDTAIRNLCRRYFRDVARRRDEISLDAVVDLAPGGVSDVLTQVAAIADLRRAWVQLSPECRELIRNKYVVGESLSEIGARLGVPEKTARSRLHTCRTRLRRLLRGQSTSSR